jgi:cytochrome P450
VEFHREATRITMAIASKALFDTDTFDETDEIGEALTVALRWASDASASFNLGLQAEIAASLDHAAERFPGRVGSAARAAALSLDRPIVWPGRRGRELRAAVRLLDARVQRMIDERRASAQGTACNDLLSRLLSASVHHQDHSMSDRQVRDEVLTLFVAGHETTATALTWAFYYVGKDPPLLAALEAEALALNRIPTVDDLPQLPLTQKVFKESLRIMPPVPVFERQALEPVEIGGQRLAPGGHVVVLPWALHHREALWPEPDRFDPERFAPEAESARPRHAYVPFGAGPRVCIGNQFALLEGPLVLATLLRCARFELLRHEEVKPDPRVATMRPLGDIPIRVSPRGAP